MNGEWKNLESLLVKIKGAIGNFDPPRFSNAARWVESVYDLQKKYESFQNEVAERISEAGAIINNSVPQEPTQGSSKEQAGDWNGSLERGGKARSRECRRVFLAQQAKLGKSLERVRGVLHKSRNGAIVGIAYAMGRKSEWFLGLPAEKFQEAALLCEQANNLVQPIYLPESFISKYRDRFPISTQYSQSKFVVRWKAGKYYLIVSGVGDVDLTAFLEGNPMVCPRVEYI